MPRQSPNDRRSQEHAIAQIAAAELFDLDWYTAQAGGAFADQTEAITDYVNRGAARDLSPHPLFEARWVYPGGRWRSQAPDPLSFFLARLAQGEDKSPHPLLDSGRALLGLRSDAELAVPVGRSMSFADLRLAALGNLSEPDVADDIRETEISVLVPMTGRLARGWWWLRQLWRTKENNVSLIAATEHPADGRLTALACLTLPGVRTLTVGQPLPRTGTIIEVDPRLNVPTVPMSGPSWINLLAEAANDHRMAIPLLVEKDHTVVAAGAFCDAGQRSPLLAGATVDDVQRMVRIAGPVVPAALSPMNAHRAGVDPTQVALVPSVRVVAPPGTEWPDGAATSTPAPSSTGLLAAAGYGTDGRPLLSVREGRPQLRWAIDIAAPLASRGRRWGDDVFARSLAEALEQLGQRVSIDHPETRGRSNRTADDVVLTVRGLDRVRVNRANPEATHVLWVISHPADVTAEECAEHDLTFAAGATWARTVSLAWNLPVTPLLQCTDPSRFTPTAGNPDSGPDLLAVLNARGGMRPVVDHALRAGLPLTLYGDGWSGLVPDGVVAGIRIPNQDLGRAYASAGVVLADHWDDMRELGFISNRVFDVLACAGRLWVDDVAGLTDVLGADAVRVWRGADDFAEARGNLRGGYPPRAERVALAERVRTQHSFAARANQLLEAVLSRRTRTTPLMLE